MLMLIPLFPNVVVATDDEKIASCCRGFGADVIMTSESCRNGKGCSIIVNFPLFSKFMLQII